jgi:hypothetical protein
MRRRTLAWVCALLGIGLGLAGGVRADASYSVEIASVEYENPLTRDALIVTINERYGKLEGSFELSLRGKDGVNRVTAPFETSASGGPYRFRLRLPGLLDDGTYIVWVKAKNSSGDVVAENTSNFTYQSPFTAVPTPAPASPQASAPTEQLPILLLLVLVAAAACFAAYLVYRQRGRKKAKSSPTPLPKLEKSDIFISYSRSDWAPFVEPMVKQLRDENLSVWVDQHLLHSGDDWLDKIDSALEMCQCMILCVSPEAMASRFVKIEYRYFFTKGKTIYPLLCRPVDDLPVELQGIQYYTYERLPELISLLKSELAQPQG